MLLPASLKNVFDKVFLQDNTEVDSTALPFFCNQVLKVKNTLKHTDDEEDEGESGDKSSSDTDSEDGQDASSSSQTPNKIAITGSRNGSKGDSSSSSSSDSSDDDEGNEENASPNEDNDLSQYFNNIPKKIQDKLIANSPLLPTDKKKLFVKW